MTEDELPTFQHGYSMSKSDGKEMVQAEPGLSSLRISGDPRDPEEMSWIRSVGIGEDTLHIHRQRFGLSRATCLLKQEMREYFCRVIQNDIDVELGAEKIALRRKVCDDIHNKRVEILEGVDKFLNISLLSDQEYLDNQAEVGEGLAGVSKDQAIEEMERFRNTIQDEIDKENIESYQVKEITSRLEKITKEYNRKVAETVGDVAVDIPYLIEPAEYDDIRSINVEELDLRDRFEKAIDAFERLDQDPKRLLSDGDDSDFSSKLFVAIKEELGEPSYMDSKLGDLELPLIDKPIELSEVDPEISPGIEELSETGYLINRAFDSVGTAGGATYRFENSEGTISTAWIVNPHLQDEPISDGRTYQELWTHAYVVEQLCSQVDRAARDLRHAAIKELSTRAEAGEIDLFGDIKKVLRNEVGTSSGDDYLETVKTVKNQLNRQEVRYLKNKLIDLIETEDPDELLNKYPPAGEVEISCPLCDIKPNHKDKCGGEICNCKEYKELTKDAAPDLIRYMCRTYIKLDFQ